MPSVFSSSCFDLFFALFFPGGDDRNFRTPLEKFTLRLLFFIASRERRVFFLRDIGEGECLQALTFLALSGVELSWLSERNREGVACVSSRRLIDWTKWWKPTPLPWARLLKLLQYSVEVFVRSPGT